MEIQPTEAKGDAAAGDAATEDPSIEEAKLEDFIPDIEQFFEPAKEQASTKDSAVFRREPTMAPGEMSDSGGRQVNPETSPDSALEGEGRIQVQSLYNLELAIYTVSGHRYRATLDFKDRVNSGRMSYDRAIQTLEKVENDVRHRTFQRPISYMEEKEEGPVEFIFNPANIECLSVTRHP